MSSKAESNRVSKRRMSSGCQHSSLSAKSSFHAPIAGYTQPSAQQRAKAQGVKFEKFEDRPYTFPAPLILPDDDLAIDPGDTPQSVVAWARAKERNSVNSRRRTVYIVPSPLINSEMAFIEAWSAPSSSASTSPSNAHGRVNIEHIANFTRAFYHPLPVKILPVSTFKFDSWSPADLAKIKSTSPAARRSPDHGRPVIGLQSASEMIGIRTRSTPRNEFPQQLNLDDLLDAAIGLLPDDAYALVMLVDQDLYEDEDDDFVCGRAYGGSRVAVVSTARYNPTLDKDLGMDSDHVWPLSHCLDYHQSFDPGFKRQKAKKMKTAANTGSEPSPQPHSSTPLQSAVDAVLHFRSSGVVEARSATWLSRVARTVVHELGHCFGIGHCVYYACVMQGSASLKEDQRQPPYLCPVDLTKVLKATGTSEDGHLRALDLFCQQHEDVEMFVALGGWVKARLKELGRQMD